MTTCHTIGQRLDGLPVTRKHYAITAIVGLGILFDFYEVFLSGTLSTVLQRSFEISGLTLKFVLASAFIGMFVGAITLGRLADRIGRRRAFFLTLSLYSLFSLAAAFSPNVELLIVFRFLAGIGIGAELPICDSYLADLMPARVRGRMVAFAYTIGFCGTPICGFLAVAIASRTVLGVEGWRWMFAIGAAGALVCWALRFALPESPRWLERAGRLDEADRVVRSMEHGAGVSEPPPAVVPPPGAHTGTTAKSPVLPAERSRLRQLFNRTYLPRTIMIWSFQILQPLGYYGFGTLVPLVLAAKGFDIVTGLAYSALTFIGYPIGSALSIPIMERMQRKNILIVSAALMAIFGLLFGLASASWAILTLGFIYTAISNVFSNGYHAYQGELYPTALRASGAGIAYAIGRLSTAAMPFILVPFLDGAGAVAMFGVVAAAMVVLCLVVAALGPRTTGISVDVISAETDTPTNDSVRAESRTANSRPASKAVRH